MPGRIARCTEEVSRSAAAAFSALVSLLGVSPANFAQQQPKNKSKVDVQRTLRRYGQAAIEGTVTDVVRVVIVGANIKLVNERTKQEIRTRTNENGRFRIADLEPGSYTIHAESPGFIKLTFSHLNLAEEEALNLDVSLKVGEALIGVVVVVSPAPLPTNDTILPGELKRKDRPHD